MALLTTAELMALTLPEPLLKKELYDKTPGWRIRHDKYNLVNLVTQIMALSTGSITHAMLSDNANGTYTFTPVTGASILIDTRALSNPVDTAPAQIPVTINTTQEAIEDLYHFMNNVKGILGITWTNGITNPNMGSYTGWTITDNQTVKENIQELELAVQDSLHLADNGLSKITGTGVGLAQSKVQLGGALIQDTDITTDGFRYQVLNTISNLGTRNDALPGYNYGGSDEAQYFQGNGPEDRAISGIKLTDGDYIPFLFREDTAAQTNKVLELDTVRGRMYSTNSATHRSILSVYANGVRQEVEYDAGYSNKAYTELRNNSFRIGSSVLPAPITTQFYDLPLIDGTSNQILITDGAGSVTWQSLPGALLGAENGLNIVGTKTRLGGNLIVDTDVVTNGFKFNLRNAGSTVGLNITDTQVEMKTTTATMVVDGEFKIATPGYYSGGTFGGANTYGTAGRLLQNVNITTGVMEMTPFVFPLTDGTSGQKLRTNGTGTLSWIDDSEIVSFQEFLSTESLTVRGGETVWGVPTVMNGMTLVSIKLISRTAGATDATVDVVMGATTHTITIVGGNIVANLTGLSQTVTEDEQLIINVTAVGATPPSGLTALLTFLPL